MKTEQRWCGHCEDDTEQVSFGFLPLSMWDDGTNELWINASFCPDCESLLEKEVSEEMLRRAEERYLHGLVELGHMERSEARKILGIS